MANNKLKINIDSDTSEALKQMKEVTQAANECMKAFEKLERVMGKFTNQNETVEIYCDSKVIVQFTIKQTTDSIKMTVTDLKGVR
ncbi:hypothetical protein [Bacillus toyonensis]|uniref:hypothetical protein n=1 Tax=Bacillus toyonensis TaxID=155322 RepID=UPI000BFB9C9E|nr:hypothetical protein [Bacillus toyonensis]PHB47010.1 hypothetical protein COE91_24990 [Bacillus toyonensis]HDR7851195.1 hypothetical protein [Bacillus toyonensis]